MNQLGRQSLGEADAQGLVQELWGVRYQVKDVSRSIDFYTKKLGFKLDHKHICLNLRRSPSPSSN